VERCRTTMPTAMNSADATASSTAISSRDTRVPPSLRREEYAPDPLFAALLDEELPGGAGERGRGSHTVAGVPGVGLPLRIVP